MCKQCEHYKKEMEESKKWADFCERKVDDLQKTIKELREALNIIKNVSEDTLDSTQQ